MSEKSSRYVGKPILRTEDPKYLTGRGNFIDDIALPGLTHAAFLRSPYPHAYITTLDTSSARALEGVVGVFTADDLKDIIDPVLVGVDEPKAVTQEQLPLARDKVRYVGEPVAVVIAQSRYVAEDACELIDIEWEPLSAVVDAEQALAADAPTIDDSVPENRIVQEVFEGGDVDDAVREASPCLRKAVLQWDAAFPPRLRPAELSHHTILRLVRPRCGTRAKCRI